MTINGVHAHQVLIFADVFFLLNLFFFSLSSLFEIEFKSRKDIHDF